MLWLLAWGTCPILSSYRDLRLFLHANINMYRFGWIAASFISALYVDTGRARYVAIKRLKGYIVNWNMIKRKQRWMPRSSLIGSLRFAHLQWNSWHNFRFRDQLPCVMIEMDSYLWWEMCQNPEWGSFTLGNNDRGSSYRTAISAVIRQATWAKLSAMYCLTLHVGLTPNGDFHAPVTILCEKALITHSSLKPLYMTIISAEILR